MMQVTDEMVEKARLSFYSNDFTGKVTHDDNLRRAIEAILPLIRDAVLEEALSARPKTSRMARDGSYEAGWWQLAFDWENRIRAMKQLIDGETHD